MEPFQPSEAPKALKMDQAELLEAKIKTREPCKMVPHQKVALT